MWRTIPTIYQADSWKKSSSNSTIENLYGPTEATIYISRFNYLEKFKDDIFKNGILPIGIPFEDHNVIIIDESFNKLEDGKIGEICFSGKQLSTGYLKDFKKTDDVLYTFIIKDGIGLEILVLKIIKVS